MRLQRRRVLSWGMTSLLASVATLARGDQRTLRTVGHAHNDYHHRRPLHDALEHGFGSVEADIFLVQDQLLVGHDLHELSPTRTLQSLYLDPLRKEVASHSGRVPLDGLPFTLLIDIKENGSRVYAVLRELLAEYREILTSVCQGTVTPRAVQVVISGDCPRSEISSEQERYAGIDGRLTDLDSTAPPHLIPWISDRWPSHFRWWGVGTFAPDERRKLITYVQRAHAAGRRVRFWATPEKPALWRELRAAEVDLINTDRLDDLRDFLGRK